MVAERAKRDVSPVTLWGERDKMPNSISARNNRIVEQRKRKHSNSRVAVIRHN